MSNFYPSLEDFKYDILVHSKHPSSNIGTHLRGVANGSSTTHDGIIMQNGHQKYAPTSELNSFYPSFSNHTNDHHHHDHHHDLYPIVGAQSLAVALPGGSSYLAPLSGISRAHRYQPSNTIKPIVVCKDSNGKVGLRLASVQGGVFVVLVYADSPAAMAGLKFGDQILEINDIPVAGYSMNKAHQLIRKSSPDEVRFAIRDRPFERTVTLHKDQEGFVGFIFNKRGRIVSIVKDSSSARNGLLIDHNILEINAQNIVGMDKNEIRAALDNCGDVVILTVMPSKIFEALIKDTDPELIRKNMNHTAPDI